MVVIRPFTSTAENYTNFVTIWNTCLPEAKMFVSEWQHIDKTRPEGSAFMRVFAEINGNPVGLAQCFEAPFFRQPGRYSFDICVLPIHQHQGIGSRLF